MNAPVSLSPFPQPVGLPPAHLRARFYALMTADRLLWRGANSASPFFAAKQRLVEQMQAASPFQDPIAPEPMPEVDARDLDRASFMALTRGLRTPLVMRGFAKDSAAVRRWTPDYLEAHLGDRPCMVVTYDDDTIRRNWDVGAELGALPFSDVLQRMSTERLYINNSTELFSYCPELIDDLELGRLRGAFMEPEATWDEFVTTSLFLGSAQVGTACHHAPGGNFFLQLAGRKSWTLLDPAYTPYLHPIPGRPFQYSGTAYAGWRGCTFRGEHDAFLFKLPRYEVTLEPGDLLYNAPWWWHEVENLDPFVVGCAVRHVPRPGQPAPTIPNLPIFGLTSRYPALRALSFIHYLRHQLVGDRRPLRDTLNELQMRGIYESLEREEGEASR